MFVRGQISSYTSFNKVPHCNRLNAEADIRVQSDIKGFRKTKTSAF